MKPKILLFDLETSPNVAHVWGKWEQNVLSYVKEWEILSVAYKWLGQKRVSCLTQEGQGSDKKILEKLHALFGEADILVAHNGDEFDIKKARARMIYHGMAPPRSPARIDTKKVAKAYFNFNGNSLDDLGQYLKLGRKYKHPGFDMWLGCMRGDKKSWREMAYYNKKDVELLEKVYLRFKPWILNHPNLARLLNPAERRLGVCPHCASQNVQRRGYRAANQTLRQLWQCRDCSAWFMTRIPPKGPGSIK
jgi:DNA polymerase elongation subunit (family B)